MNTLPYLRNFELGGQVALVTGSARGLGLCIARALAGCARVLINGRNATAAEAAADALRRDGLDAHALAFDVADDAAMAQAFARIDAEHGRLDILVNNVGARNRKTLADTTPAEIRELIDTDLVAGLLLSKLAAERMVRQGGGRLIAITSVVGEFARAGDAVYPAAKQGLTGMMRALAAEFGGRGITSNAIAPGTFATETNAAMIADPSVGPRRGAQSDGPLGRAGGNRRRRRVPGLARRVLCQRTRAGGGRRTVDPVLRERAATLRAARCGPARETPTPRATRCWPQGAVLRAAQRKATATATASAPASASARLVLVPDAFGQHHALVAVAGGIMGKQFSCAATATSRK